jgi:16S rRNA (cytidine1402-2'-O)-methyltransferase
MTGTLYLVATPIGNLEDMTYRAVRILSEVDLIAAEDTRNSIKLLNHFDIKTPMTSYHEFNKYDKAAELVGKLANGTNIACITDAGTPGISDPGEELVRQCYEAGITVVPIPGACAAVNGLIASGLPTRRFAFEAFLPTDKKERKLILDELKTETRTMVIYEAPHRLLKTLNELSENLGADRDITICRELTKKHETFFPTNFGEAVNYYTGHEVKGECIIVIKGLSHEDIAAGEAKKWEAMSIEEHLKMYIAQGMDKKSATKQVALDRKLPKREVYEVATTI